MSDVASIYLDLALDYMQAHSIMRDTVDWPGLRAAAFANAANAQATGDTYTAIRQALHDLGDNHSRFLEPQEVNPATRSAGNRPPSASRLSDGFGYLEIPPFTGSAQAAVEYATQIQQQIRDVDEQPTNGWIVDLQRNGGGNMWPMLAGVGPILGEGNVGGFRDAYGNLSVFAYRNGQALLDNNPMCVVAGAPYAMKRPMPAVAVLTGQGTVSAAEAITVAFRARPRTRSFGGSTSGVPSNNVGQVLSDGAEIVLTEGFDVDRAGNVYRRAIVPDQLVATGSQIGWMGTAQDPTRTVADEWLHSLS